MTKARLEEQQHTKRTLCSHRDDYLSGMLACFVIEDSWYSYKSAVQHNGFDREVELNDFLPPATMTNPSLYDRS